MTREEESRPKKSTLQQKKDAYINDRLKPLLDTYPFFKSNSSMKVLSIGCGDEPIELLALNELASEYKVGFTYSGLDIDPDSITTCKDNYPINNAAFYATNCCDLPSIQNNVGTSLADLVIARHPVFLSVSPATICFEYIFTSVIPRLLAEQGTLLISFFHEEEKNACMKLMKNVTTTAPVELKESKEIYSFTEILPKGLTDGESICFSDRYMVAYPNFELSPALKTEINTNPSSTEESKNIAAVVAQKLLDRIQNEVLKDASPSTKMAAMLCALIENPDMLTPAQVNDINIIANTNSVNNIPLDSSALSWKLIRSGVTKKNFSEQAAFKLTGLLKSLVSMIVRLNEMYRNESKEAFMAACEQGLKLLAARPLFQDIFSQPVEGQSTKSSLHTMVTPGFF